MKGNLLFLVYTLFIFLLSASLHTAPSLLALICVAAGYALTHLFERRLPPQSHTAIQLTLLITFHAASATDWFLPLYLFHIMQQFRKVSGPRSIAIVYALSLAYILVAFTYKPFDFIHSLETLYIAGSGTALAYLFRQHLHVIERHNRQLSKETKRLSTHDALTNLYNYEEFHRRLERLVASGQPVALVLMDFKDLKSLNTTAGFQGVNQILKQTAQLLRIMFPEASLMSRYGGDEFAFAVQTNDLQPTMNTITQVLSSEFPKLTGVDIHFGIASSPVDGITKDDLIVEAEHRLYLMKRETWLKREDHMLRNEKLRVVGELASGMAHEIRNPLTTIKGFLQLSRAGKYNIEPWYDLIMDEINRMSMLTAEFLQFSKPHVTTYRVQSLQSCIHRVLSLLDSETTRLGHRFNLDCTDQPMLVLMDQDKMLQLLLNLVKNAFEALPGQGVVGIRLTAEQSRAVLAISDNGKGIPEEELNQIFLPFYTTKEAGTGLGLSICHKIVHDHEGTMEVESVVNKGTKFTITLPLCPSQPSDSGDASARPRQEETTVSV